MELTSWDLQIVRHYERFLGQPDEVTRLDHDCKPAPNPIFVLDFSPASQDDDWVYATVGASRQIMPYPDNWSYEKQKLRMELFIYSRRPNHELRELLLNLAVYPFTHGTFLAPGHVIPGKQSIVTGSSLTDVLFTMEYGRPQEFHLVHHSDGDHTQMLWVVPIYASEHKLFKEHGWDALKELFYQHSADTSDFFRPPVI